MTDTPTPETRTLPEPVALLIATAALILWIVILGAMAAYILLDHGRALPIEIFPTGLSGRLAGAVAVQTGLTLLGVLAIWSLASWVAGTHYFGDRAAAPGHARIMVSVLMVLAVLRLVGGVALPLATGGWVQAVPLVVFSLPMVLVEIAFLLCARRYLAAPAGTP